MSLPYPSEEWTYANKADARELIVEALANMELGRTDKELIAKLADAIGQELTVA